MAPSTNEIHPSAIIQGDVRMGENNQILPYSILIGPLEIGDNNIIGHHVLIGSPGEDTKNPRYDASRSPIKIGNRNIIREFTAIQKPCYRDQTTIGDDVFLMHGVHIPHDAILENKVVVTPLVAIGGISTILEGSNLGMNCSVHQYSIVGQYSIVATGSSVVKNVKPFSRYIPGKEISVNRYALEKFGFESFTDEVSAYVLNGKLPKSDIILKYVEKYEKLHKDSGREQY